MSRSLILSLFFLSSLFAIGQMADPVHWQAKYKATSATEGNIIVSAVIDKGWHTYSQRPTDAGPIPTSFSFIPSKEYKLDGATIENDAHEEFVPAFEAKIFVFTTKAEFTQKIKHSGKPGFTVNLKVEYMSCNDKMCLPPKTIDLSVKAQ